MNTDPLNPLLMMILSRACSAVNLSPEEQDSDPPPSSIWRPALSSALLNPARPPLSVAWLAENWGKAATPALDVPSSPVTADGVPTAVRLRWDPSWTESWPPQWSRLMRWQASGMQLWLEVPPEPQAWEALNAPVLRNAVQMGWAWWCTPPAKAETMPDYLAAYRPMFRYWFTAQASDQWTWPWTDMAIARAAEMLGANGVKRPWITDARRRPAWQKIEEAFWADLLKLAGGEAELRAIALAAFADKRA